MKPLTTPTDRKAPSPLVGRVRGHEDGLTRRQRLPATIATRSRALRKEAGEPERRLWQALQETFSAIRFRRPVPLGIYHADFCSHSGRLVVEVNGDDHARRIDRDAARTRILENEGYRVMRVSNSEVMTNLDGVLVAIGLTLQTQGGRP